ncbi:MAG: carbon-nitrogen family hydrolase, partial [Gammaproteobacteria bacterium]|nr:carbon-nitrogen family hydrolase [Gammaproteobacteria bacterium]
MKKKLCVAAVQFNISLGDINLNLETVEDALARLAKQAAQLVVLPEMW